MAADMDFTPRLAVPYLAAQQAQKHVTYNEAMNALDTLVQPSVLSATTTAPPAGPAEGDTYLVPAGATGGWAGQSGRIARWQDGTWMFIAPAEGWLIYVADTTRILMRSGGVWTELVSTGGSSVAMFGINGTADATNRFTVAAQGSLFSHDGDSHRLGINKAAGSDTGSILFETGWSGRAEIGLAGDDDLHVKVSANGSTWTEALMISRSGGAVSLKRGQLAFPSAQNPSSDPNTLDDYEEGSWTPMLSAQTGTLGAASASGTYTKIGRVVLFQASITITTNGTAAGDLRFTLPFTPAGNGVGYARETQSTGVGSSVEIISGSTVAIMNRTTDNGYPGGSGYGFKVAGHFVA